MCFHFMLLAIVPLHFQDYFPTPITDQNEVDETELRGEEVGEHCFGLLVIYFDLVYTTQVNGTFRAR